MLCPSVPIRAMQACDALRRLGRRWPTRLRHWLNTLAAFVVVGLIVFTARPAISQTQGVRAEVNVNASGGYTRLVLRFSEEIEAQVRLSSSILVITFSQPVDISVDRLN